MRKIEYKIWITFLVTAAFFIVVTGLYALFNMHVMNRAQTEAIHSMLHEEYDKRIQNEVDTAYQVVNRYYEKSQAGSLSLEEAKDAAVEEIKALTYGTDGYFWIDDTEGILIAHPLQPENEGTNRLGLTDPNGVALIQEIIKAATEGQNNGFTDFMWEKPDSNGALSPKRAYSKLFEPWGWIISTGNYVDDIDTAVQNKNQQLSKEFKRKSMEIAGIILLSLVGMSVVAIFVSRGIASPILKLVEAFEKDENGQIRIQETHIRSRDEVGKLGKTLNVLSEQIREFINGVAAESEHVSQSAILVRSNIMELNQEITEISASTQEIAAGAEETTAISQNMSERSAQLLHASKEMKEEARQATNSVQEMNHRADQLKAEFEMAVENSTKIMNEAEIKLTKATKEAQAVERVSELADIIVQITEQTNLLALNAAIEAARAGEAGKGFAVVAEEIRKLADDSKETVVKIQEVILQIVSGVDTLKVNANELLSFLSTDVKRDYESMLQASDAYSLDTRQLEGVVVGFTKRANELERAMEDMAKAMEEISISTYEGAKGSGNISQSVENVSVQTEQLLTQAEVSSQYAKNLLQLIGKFKV